MVDGIDIRKVNEIVARCGRDRSATIPILRGLQDEFNYLPRPALEHVCEITDIRPADMTGVSTFYSQFRHTPAGQYTIKVCIGTACHVKGAETIYNGFKHSLHIPETEDTDSERLFTVEKVACLGCCMLAPAVQIDDITYGFLTLQKIPHVLRDFLEAKARSHEQRKTRQADAKPAGEIRTCLCSSCGAAGSVAIMDAFKNEIQDLHLPVTVKTVGCTGISYEAPLIHVAMSSGQTFHYGRVQQSDVRAILSRHFAPTTVSGRIRAAADRVLEQLLTDDSWEPATRYAHQHREQAGHDYHSRQVHLVMKNSGEMDPLDIEEYRAHDGFIALKKCMDTMSPDDVISTITDSGLRGRGGGGFDTGRKWKTVRDQESSTKYLICNGDEGDPGAFMDRMILESFPFRVLEGMAIAALAIGASEAFVYVRAEYPLAVERLRSALRLCETENVLPITIRVMEGAGAFVCGEETALISAIEGKRGMPRFRPPYPSEQGLWGQPTLVNNVETFSLIPGIIMDGPESFRKIGTDTSKGTKAFALAGKINRGGLIEVPMGLTLRDIVHDIGGGIQDGRQLKAVQIGGPSGGCIPETLLDLPVDYDALTDAGAMMGSGGLVVLDDTDCMVDIARYFLAFTQQESCGKCTHCRIGTKCMLEILERLCEGRAREDDLDKLEHLAATVQNGSLCGLGRTAPNPVLSTLKHFRHEYEEHLKGRCPARKCKALVRYEISDKCIGCTRCAQRCPVDAIEMHPYEQHEIDTDKCTRCDTCRQVCPVEAITILNNSVTEG